MYVECDLGMSLPDLDNGSLTLTRTTAANTTPARPLGKLDVVTGWRCRDWRLYADPKSKWVLARHDRIASNRHEWQHHYLYDVDTACQLPKPQST